MTQSPAIVFAPEKVSIEKALSVAWQCTKREFVPLLVVMLISWAIPLFVSLFFILVGFAIPKDQSILQICYGLITTLVSGLIGAVMELGMVNVQLKVLDGGSAKVSDLFSANQFFVKYALGSFSYNVLAFWGYIFLFIPGIIVNCFMQFYSYFIVDKALGPIESLRASWIASRGARINILLMVLIFHALRTVGTVLLFIGLIPAQMIISLATAELYRQLVKNTSPEDFVGIEGLRYSLPTQEDYDRGHVIQNDQL